jgi:hypothetical protein
MFLDRKYFFRADTLHDIIAQFRVLEMEEMAGIVPYKTIFVDCFAVTAYLFFGFDYLIVGSSSGRVTQTGDSGSNDKVHT